MGTRSWTRFFKRTAVVIPKRLASSSAAHHDLSRIKMFSERQHVGTIYRQFDGYPEGVGAEIVQFLRTATHTDDAMALQKEYQAMIRANGDLNCEIEGLPSKEDEMSVHLFIEWVYDVEVTEDGRDSSISLGIIPGAAQCDIFLTGDREEYAVKGTPEEVGAWITRP